MTISRIAATRIYNHLGQSLKIAQGLVVVCARDQVNMWNSVRGSNQSMLMVVDAQRIGSPQELQIAHNVLYLLDESYMSPVEKQRITSIVATQNAWTTAHAVQQKMMDARREQLKHRNQMALAAFNREPKKPVVYLHGDEEGRTIFIASKSLESDERDKHEVEVAGPYGSRNTHVSSMLNNLRNILEAAGVEVVIE